VSTLASDGGFTLVELLVALVAALVVFGATLTLLVPSQRVQARASEWALVLHQDRAGLAQMVHDIRQASKLEETKASAMVFLATIGGKPWKIKYQCNVSQSGTTFTQCERLAAEEGKALPGTGPPVTTDMVNGSSVFSYSPVATPTVATIKIELPSTGTLVQPGGEGHKIVLEDDAFMRYQYLAG
jgi:prepilin-type N-terminal cleavage/methylation domain-containing protein